MGIRSDFFSEMGNSLTCGGQIVPYQRSLPRDLQFGMKVNILYKPRQYFLGEEVRKED